MSQGLPAPDALRRFVTPSLREPSAILAFEGWNDAGEAASGAVHYVADAIQSVPLAEIERRLASDPTEERQQDLANSADWLTENTGTGFFDIAIDNDTAVRKVSAEVLDWLGWLGT